MKDMYKSPEPAEIINKINAKIQTHDSSDGVGEFEMKINEPIAGIPKSKYLLCRLSAMLNEDFRTKDVENIERLQKILCNTDNSTDIDIEHIQSYHDIDKSLRDSIWEEWGNEINSIGNLVILERKKNRSISNSEYQKKRECYKNSVFSIVKEISSNNEFWTKQHAERRRKNESEKIMNYIFEL